MKVLLSDGSGLTSRQCASRLSAAGHAVEVLAPDPLCLCRFTRHVNRVHRVPVSGTDPFGWLDAALAVYRDGGFDVLLPTQEQVAVLSLAASQLAGAGVATAVPPFAALAAVQDKLSASGTLSRLGIPQPSTTTGPAQWSRFPAFVKQPIGTASAAVRRVMTPGELREAAACGPVLIQAAADGPLVMCQSVFDRGQLVAFHACQRTGEGAGGGASHKLSITLPQARHWFEMLGADLGWHGALSADVILAVGGPVVIDVNPRLVEPQNAWASGVDLVGPMLDLARGAHPAAQPDGRAGVATHQLLLGLLGAAQHGQGRRGIAGELARAWRHSGAYRDSTEELSPIAHDPKALLPLAAAAAATLAAPRTWSWFATGSVANYALTPQGWQQIKHAHSTADPRSDHAPRPNVSSGRRGPPAS